jgi:hypothetical protein
VRRNPLSVQQSLQVIDLLQQGVRERHSGMAAAASAHTAAASAAPATAAVAAPGGSASASHKRKRESAAPTGTGELESSATDEQRDGICMGINAVTRAAEQGRFRQLAHAMNECDAGQRRAMRVSCRAECSFAVASLPHLCASPLQALRAW